jgi:hypothetical protein
MNVLKRVGRAQVMSGDLLWIFVSEIFDKLFKEDMRILKWCPFRQAEEKLRLEKNHFGGGLTPSSHKDSSKDSFNYFGPDLVELIIGILPFLYSEFLDGIFFEKLKLDFAFENFSNFSNSPRSLSVLSRKVHVILNSNHKNALIRDDFCVDMKKSSFSAGILSKYSSVFQKPKPQHLYSDQDLYDKEWDYVTLLSSLIWKIS